MPVRNGVEQTARLRNGVVDIRPRLREGLCSLSGSSNEVVDLGSLCELSDIVHDAPSADCEVRRRMWQMPNVSASPPATRGDGLGAARGSSTSTQT